MKTQDLLEKIKPENIILVADDHIRIYTNRINSGASNVRVGECQRYLEIWQSIKDKGGIVSALIPAERQELIDAVFDGSYDDTLGIPEEYKDQVEVDDEEEDT